MTKIVSMLVGLTLVLIACGGSAEEITTTEAAAPATTEAAPATTTPPAEPPLSPAEVVFEAQSSDGSSIVVASVTLPSAGFIAVHGNADGSPGPVVGHSDLLPAGTSTGVEVTLDTPLTSTDTLFPMAHVDVDGDGVYTFEPPDNAIDVPATTAAGDVAVVSAEVTVATSSDAGAALALGSSDLGDHLVDADGTTLYLFLPDDRGDSTCYDQCEENWPPLSGTLGAGDGIDASLIGSVTRTDGVEQVTYNGWPLYYFVGDATPGDTNGQGLNDVWFVVSAAGEAIN